MKSQIGHTKAAAGAAGLIKAALALHHKVLPPTIKVTKPVEPLATADSPFYVNTEMRPWLPRADHPRRAAVCAFGFGGSNFHAVLEEYRPEKREVGLGRLGRDRRARRRRRRKHSRRNWRRCRRSGPHFARFAEAVARDVRPDREVPARLRGAPHTHRSAETARRREGEAREPSQTRSRGTRPRACTSAPVPRRVNSRCLFPGQGSQAVGMLRDLACLFPEMLESLASRTAPSQRFRRTTTDVARLSDRIYPPTTFDPDRKKYHDADLRETRNAQPALGAVSFGAWRVLARAVRRRRPTRSPGTATANWSRSPRPGGSRPVELFALSRLRGRLMGEQRAGDPGAMLAVLAPIADIERVIADRYARSRRGEQERAEADRALRFDEGNRARARSVLGRRCEVRAAAGRGRIPQPVRRRRRRFRSGRRSESVEFAPAQRPVFANTTATEYPDDPAAARDLLANQLAKPVAFVEEIRAMVDRGVRTFVEVGPGSVLTRLTEAILAEAEIADSLAFALDDSGGKRSGVLDLANALARLLARGHRVSLDAWEAGSRCRPPAEQSGKLGLSVPLTGANYVTPREPRPPVTRNGKHEAANGMGVGRATPDNRAVGVPVGPSSTIDLQPPRPVTVQVAEMSDANPNALAQALQMTQQSLAALQRMQEQTAALHKQFLESQEAAQRTLHALVEQQQSLLFSNLGTGEPLPVLPAIPRPAPPSVAAPQPVSRAAPAPPPAVPSPPTPPPLASVPSVNGARRASESPRCFWPWCRRRRVIPPRASISGFHSMRTSAWIRSSASKSSRRFRRNCPARRS